MVEDAAGVSGARVRTVFMGSDPISIPLLDALVAEFRDEIELVAVYTQPDRPTGRGMHLQANEIKQWAIAHAIPLRQPQRCGPEDVDWLAGQGIALVLVMAYGQILKRALIDLPALGTLNFHASLLPRLRGASPIQTAVAVNERETGVSLMRIVPKLDAGPVLDCERVAIGEDDTAVDVRGRMAAACVPLFARAWPGLREGRAVFVEQNPSEVTYCRILEKADAWLDFRAPAADLHARVRGFTPWPGSLMEVDGSTFRIGRTRVFGGPLPACEPGRVEIVRDGRGLVVHCGAGALEMLEIQKPGGRMMAVDAFLRGHAFAPGTNAALKEMRALVAPQPFPWKSSST